MLGAQQLTDASVITWKSVSKVVEPFLEDISNRLLDQVKLMEPAIAPHTHYALANHGKHLRPALLALSAGCLSPLNGDMAVTAVIIEMIHLATLVHDDVIDGAQIRRGRPTVAARWGNEISVLVGDALCARAVGLAAAFPTQQITRAVAATIQTICTGEILQIQHRGNFEMPRKEYFKVLEMKTGALFALACEFGSTLAGGSPEVCIALSRYGMATGVAYQLYDDCLDMFGSETAAGKSLGTDLISGKLTFPILYALDSLDRSGQEQLKSLIKAWEPSFMPQLQELLKRCDALGESHRVIHQYIQEAQQVLEILPESPSRQALKYFAQLIGQQTDSLG